MGFKGCFTVLFLCMVFRVLKDLNDLVFSSIGDFKGCSRFLLWWFRVFRDVRVCLRFTFRGMLGGFSGVFLGGVGFVPTAFALRGRSVLVLGVSRAGFYGFVFDV